jgi:hypothetical protein
MISTPPIVGVPALTACPAGPSSRIGCFICIAARERMSAGPNMNEMSSAVSAAMAARNVM